MGFELCAFLGRYPELRAWEQRLDAAVACELDGELGLVPVTGALFQELRARLGADEVARLDAGQPVRSFPSPSHEAGASRWASDASRGTVTAYVDLGEFGNQSHERARLWSDGRELPAQAGVDRLLAYFRETAGIRTDAWPGALERLRGESAAEKWAAESLCRRNETTRLAIVSYPSLEFDDRRWIESVRAAHDPQAAKLFAHFTLVFPAEAPIGDVTVEAASVAQSGRPIPFVIARAAAVRDALGHAGGHVFLVPDAGAAAIRALHERLYAGLRRPHLRPGIPFVPHITVGAGRDFSRCEALADDLNRRLRRFAGTLDSVEVVRVTGNAVVSTGRQRLG